MVCVVETSLGISSKLSPYNFVGNKCIYIVGVKGIRVTLKILAIRSSCESLADWPSHEILAI